LATYGPGKPAGPELSGSIGVQALQEAIPAGRHAQVNWQNNWSVSNALTDAGQSDAAADALMLQASHDGILASPGRFAARGLVRQIDFWRSVYSPDQALYAAETVPGAEPPAGQSAWENGSAIALRGKLLSAAPSGTLLFVELTSLLALLGLSGLLILPGSQRTGLVLLALVASLAVLTAALELPNYRYRMVLEPLLIPATLVGGQIWCRAIRLGVRALRTA
ncbi:MAG: hypothetical protein Q7U75_00860, partial [Desulfobacterales bacterium]|nr:hypothetical protein [Desulfobacterales bacterium]